MFPRNPKPSIINSPCSVLRIEKKGVAMSRKLGQIIAVRENTWTIRIPLGCDPETKERTYYNRSRDIGPYRRGFAESGIGTIGAYQCRLHIGCLFPRAPSHAG